MKNQGETTTNGGHRFCYSGKGDKHEHGVGSNLPSLPVCRVVYPFFTTSTRLPVFLNFYPFWEFRFQKKKSKKKKIVLFLPVNIGEIRELIKHFRSYRP